MKHILVDNSKPGSTKFCTEEKCQWRYVTQKGLYYHLKNSHKRDKGDRFSCPYAKCAWSFNNSGHLERHVKMHELYGAKRIEMRFCGFCGEWGEAEEMNEHFSSCLKNPDLVHRCKYCNWEHHKNDKKGFFLHCFRNHQNLGKYFCFTCQKSYAHTEQLLEHFQQSGCPSLPYRKYFDRSSELRN